MSRQQEGYVDPQQAPAQPQWSPPPQQPVGWGGPGSMGPVARPIGVTLSAIWFYFIGVLLILVAAAALAIGNFLENTFGTDSNGALGGLGIFLAVVIGLFALLFILTGWGVWTGRGWGRILGLILAILGVLGGLSALSGNGTTYGIGSIVIWALVAFALFTAGPYFAARRR